MRYSDFKLIVSNATGGEPGSGQLATYNLQVPDAPIGKLDQPVPSSLDLDRAKEYQRHLVEGSLTSDQLLGFGRLLGDALFPTGQVRDLLIASVTYVRVQSGGLRIRLALAPWLSNLPWECMVVNLKGGEDTASDYLALDLDVSVVRLRDTTMAADGNAPSVKKEAVHPVQVLVTLAGPAVLPPLDLETERANLLAVLGESDFIKPDIRYPADHEVLAESAPAHVFHFAGHGRFDTRASPIPAVDQGEGVLIFDRNGNSDVYAAQNAANNLRARGVRLAVLNACETGQADPFNVWSSAAAALLTGGLSAVVGMQFKVGDNAALAFSRAFYSTLVTGATVDQAVTMGRLAVFTDSPTRDWMNPVLYLGSEDGSVFPEWASAHELKQSSLIQLDFSAHIKEKAADFVGREWLFKEIDDWLNDPDGERYFQIEGEPGSGKTAIAARLVQFNTGETTPPQGLTQIAPGFLSAWHFCDAQNLLWSTPMYFTAWLARQLGERHWRYREKLMSVLGDSGYPQNFATRVVEPLQALMAYKQDTPVVILVDSVHESRQEGDNTIGKLLEDMDVPTSMLRVIVTSWPGKGLLEVSGDTSLRVLELNAPEWRDRNQEDIHSYAVVKIDKLGLPSRLAPEFGAAALADAVCKRSEGSLLYAHVALEMLGDSKDQISAQFLEKWPIGLNGMYQSLLARVLNGTFVGPRPEAVAALAVARAPLTVMQIRNFVHQVPGQAADVRGITGILGELRPVLRVDPVLPPKQRLWSIYHPSFAAYVVDDYKAGDLALDPYEAHAHIAEAYVSNCTGNLEACDDDDCLDQVATCTHFGLRYTAYHLSEAARLSKSWLDRKKWTTHLVDWVTQDRFVETHLAILNQDWIAMREDLVLTLARASEVEPSDAAPLIVRAVQALVSFDLEHLDPKAIFAEAAKGDVVAAERRLSLFDCEPIWRQGALAAIAWQTIAQPAAIEAETRSRLDGAMALRNRLALTLSDVLTFKRLLNRLDVALRIEGNLALAPLYSTVPSPDQARKLVADLGAQEDQEGLILYGSEDIAQVNVNINNSERVLYLAERDAPLLVALCHADQAIGDPLFAEYVRIQSSNSYVEYRTEVFRRILDAVLAHPNQTWVCNQLPAIMSGVLAVGTLKFDEGLPLAIMAMQAARGSAEAIGKLNEWWKTAEGRARAMNNEPGGSDTVGHHRRRLAALAECLARLPLQIDPATGYLAQAGQVGVVKKQRIIELLSKAVALHRGYAGYMAPARLTLAETTRVCGISEEAYHAGVNAGTWLERMLADAREAAHNIHDFTFCLRTTARVNAMHYRWWQPGGFDVHAEICALAQDPTVPRYTSVHMIGETYQLRSKNQNQAELPMNILAAKSLDTLATAYHRPLSEFRRLNEGILADPPIMEDGHLVELVRVPDNRFAPYLAARFAAEALVDDGISSDRDRARLIQRLVPIAATNPTVLDTVLARLMLAAYHLMTVSQIDQLAEIAPMRSR